MTVEDAQKMSAEYFINCCQFARLVYQHNAVSVPVPGITQNTNSTVQIQIIINWIWIRKITYDIRSVLYTD